MLRALVPAILLLTGTAHAVPVRLVGAAGEVVRVSGELVAGDVAYPVTAGLADVPVPDGGTIDVALRAEGWWALPATVSASGASMRVWRTGTISGRAIAAQNVTLPSSFSAVIEAPPQPVKAVPIPRGTKFDCPVSADGTFACELPAATLDLALRAKGLTPHYVWDVTIEPRRTTKLATFTWRRGASLVVWLDRASAAAAKGTAVARLTHMIAGPPSDTAARLSIPAAEATFNERGYVQLAPLEPGTFTLEISAKGFAKTQLSPITIYEGSESVWRKAIVLDPPLAIHLTLTPPLDAQEQPWRVTFTRSADSAAPLSGSSRELVADKQGDLVIDGESPGHFRVTIADAQGNRVLAKDLRIESHADAFQTIAIEQHLVRGTVTLGEEPLEAELIFGTAHGAERVTLRSDAEGAFRGALPRLGTWPVEVRSDAQCVQVVRTIDVDGDDAIDIRLSDARISGVVIDANAERVANAEVIVAASAFAQPVRTAGDGAFELRGVSGDITLTARERRSRDESAPLRLHVAEGQEIRDVKLQLLGRRETHGRVTAAGQPLPGASVSVYPRKGGSVQRATTDRDGRFTIRLRADETEATFIIAAAGRTMSAFVRPIASDALTFDIETAGGELLVRMPKRYDRFALFHNNARLGVQELFEWTGAHGRELVQEGGALLSVSDLARGLYRACAHLTSGEEICRETLLAPRGSITIDLRQ